METTTNRSRNILANQRMRTSVENERFACGGSDNVPSETPSTYGQLSLLRRRWVCDVWSHIAVSNSLSPSYTLRSFFLTSRCGAETEGGTDWKALLRLRMADIYKDTAEEDGFVFVDPLSDSCFPCSAAVADSTETGRRVCIMSFRLQGRSHAMTTMQKGTTRTGPASFVLDRIKLRGLIRHACRRLYVVSKRHMYRLSISSAMWILALQCRSHCAQRQVEYRRRTTAHGEST